ncbi:MULTISPECIES: YegJ family protein [Flavobacteriaceae]|uniref:YegJ family protein n=1 Tax=Flavobacteriaceae TaxID=49546 RepID=UPI0010ADB816|nr:MULTISPECIES: DUF2314 domain-containing protein [Flavobacteriaceae]NJB36069.1 DUF2314 domain-containing protein [Croceivirga sp. JEA036]TKD59206.1 DUF2314 domain-containing protein [Flavobacterium sp. ASW18X]
MNLLTKLFRKRTNKSSVRKRKNQPDVVDFSKENDLMNWAIEKARLTLHYFEASLENPKPNQHYFSIKVKIEDGNNTEHIWLIEPSFDQEGNLFGIVGNEPIDVTNIKYDQKIGIDRELISDWMIVEQGRLIGGYTIRAIRDTLESHQLLDFDKSLGHLIVDEGEDHFMPNGDTPEGAILALEAAYNQDNLENALDYKDFKAEASLMLNKLENIPKTQDIIKQTAETLKLSYIAALRKEGMPKFNHVQRAFPKRERIDDNHIIITEVCTYPDHGKSVQRLMTYKSENGWKVLSIVD